MRRPARLRRGNACAPDQLPTNRRLRLLWPFRRTLSRGGGLPILHRGACHQTINRGAVEHRQPEPFGGVVAMAPRRQARPTDRPIPHENMTISLTAPFTAHHVIHSPRILDAQLARHAAISNYAQTIVNSSNVPNYGLTPLRRAGQRSASGATDT